MKIIRIGTLVLLLSALIWSGMEIFSLFNSEINFLKLKQAPISIAFFISTILFSFSVKSSLNKIALLLFIISTVVLAIGLFSEINHITFFKTESIVLLVFGAYTFRLLSEKKPIAFSLIYFLTALAFSITIVSSYSGSLIQMFQGILIILTTVCVLLSTLTKRFS